MQKLKTSLLLLTLTAVCVPQSATRVVTPEIRRVGDRLACKCGSCNNTVATCQMLECHYSLPAREKIATMQNTGASDDTIVKAFVEERGLAALAAPPTEGFNLLAWLMPFIALLCGLTFIAIYIKKFRRTPVPVTAETKAVDDRYRKQIEQELADLD